MLNFNEIREVLVCLSGVGLLIGLEKIKSTAVNFEQLESLPQKVICIVFIRVRMRMVYVLYFLFFETPKPPNCNLVKSENVRTATCMQPRQQLSIESSDWFPLAVRKQ